jgi:TPR repeat protein
MNLAVRPWIAAVIVSLLAMSTAHAEMTDAEVRAFTRDKSLAENGNHLAQFNMGINYAKGLGVAKDYVQAASWYRKAAEQGYSQSQFNLGVCYASGEGVANDFVQAVSWYRKAAEQGDSQAQSNLGYCYASGEGVVKDVIEAYAFLYLAGITDEDARKNLAILEKEMSADRIIAGKMRTIELHKIIATNIAAKTAGK